MLPEKIARAQRVEVEGALPTVVVGSAPIGVGKNIAYPPAGWESRVCYSAAGEEGGEITGSPVSYKKQSRMVK